MMVSCYPFLPQPIEQTFEASSFDLSALVYMHLALKVEFTFVTSYINWHEVYVTRQGNFSMKLSSPANSMQSECKFISTFNFHPVSSFKRKRERERERGRERDEFIR